MRRHAGTLLILALVALAAPGCSWRSLISWTGLMRGPRIARPAVPPPAATEPAASAAHGGMPDTPDTPDAHGLTRAAERALSRDSLEVAEGLLRAALRLDPAHAPALSRLSRLFHATGRHAQAVEWLAPVQRGERPFADSERATLLAGLALHLDALGEADAADAVLRSIPARERHRDGGARVYLMLRSGTPDSASAIADSQADAESRSAVAANNAGIARLRRGETAAARKALLRAIDLDPSLPGPYYNLAILEKYYRLDDEAAARWFARYRVRSSEDPDSLFAVFGRPEPRPLAEREP